MKRMNLLFLVMMVSSNLPAQTFEEWMRQHSTQIRYSLRQVLLLQQHHRLLEKGYALLQAGLFHIDSLKQSDYRQHDDYFQSLRQVKPFIALLQPVIDCQQTIDLIEQYCTGQRGEVYDQVKLRNNYYRREWTSLVSAGWYALQDDERMARLLQLHDDVKVTYRFIKIYQYGDGIFRQQQDKERNDAKGLEKLYQK